MSALPQQFCAECILAAESLEAELILERARAARAESRAAEVLTQVLGVIAESERAAKAGVSHAAIMAFDRSTQPNVLVEAWKARESTCREIREKISTINVGVLT